MSKISTTDDRDPFEQGGWNGKSATDGGPNRAGAASTVGVGIDPRQGPEPAADNPPNRSETMPDGSIAAISADAVLAFPARLAELDALAKQGDDDAADQFINLLAELGTLTATTLPGLRAHL